MSNITTLPYPSKSHAADTAQRFAKAYRSANRDERLEDEMANYIEDNSADVAGWLDTDDDAALLANLKVVRDRMREFAKEKERGRR